MTTTTKTTPAVSANVANGVLTLTFSNGNTLSVRGSDLSTTLQDEAILHGLKQKLMDCAAIARDTVTGRSATIADKFEAVNECFLRLTSPDGTWNKIREGGTSTNKGGLLLLAVMELTGKSREDITAFLNTKSKEEIAALRADSRIADIITRLSVARAKPSTIDTDSMLNGLMD